MLNKRLMKTRKQITEFTTQLLELTQSTSIEYAKEQGQKCKDKVQECARGMLLRALSTTASCHTCVLFCTGM